MNKKGLQKYLSIQAITIEIFSVVFGVLLALGINGWRENRENQKSVNIVLENIKNEMDSNIKLLERVYENNSETVRLATLNMDVENDTTESRTIIPGIMIQETAWNTLVSTGISQYVDYETLYKLSRAYSLQENYKKVSMALVQSAMNASAFAAANNNPVDNDIFTKEFLDSFRMIVQMEEQLLKEYRELSGKFEIDIDNTLEQDTTIVGDSN